MIFDAVRTLAEQVCKAIDSHDECSLEVYANLFEAYTKIDRVQFIGYDCSPDNPILGSFRRYEYRRPYSSQEVLVEVRYANHLDLNWQRFVVIKELCHALEVDRGHHSVEDTDVVKLVTDLYISSVGIEQKKQTLALSSERAAEVGAIELLMPLKLRHAEIGLSAVDDVLLSRMSKKFLAPDLFVTVAFDPEYLSMADEILNNRLGV